MIATRGNEIAKKKILHPNDHCNMSQSSNDTFPTAMHIAAVLAIEDKLMPGIDLLAATFDRLMKENEGIVKTGRTHLQDAVPIAFSQEISGWRTMLLESRDMIEASLPFLKKLALGGTAVGTGLNAPKGFAEMVARVISELTGQDFTSAPNKFHALSSKDAMVAVQVMGNDATIGIAASQGNFELNVFMPVIIYNFLQSTNLLADSIKSFNDKCVAGIVANKEKMHENLHRSLMLVTALNPYIGYEHSAKTAQKAFRENISLKEACVALGYLTAEKFDEVFHPEEMI